MKNITNHRNGRPLHILRDKKSSTEMFEKQNQCLWHVDHIISHFFTELKIYHYSLIITHMTISTLLIQAVCRAHVIHKPCIWPSSPQVLCSSVVRASDQFTEGHRFSSFPGLRFFLCPVLVTCWSHHFLILPKSASG